MHLASYKVQTAVYAASKSRLYAIWDRR